VSPDIPVRVHPNQVSGNTYISAPALTGPIAILLEFPILLYIFGAMNCLE
jgi:hypothetical protein